MQFLAGEINQHPRRIATGDNGPFQKRALVFPVERIEKSAGAKTDYEKPEDAGRNRKSDPKPRECDYRGEKKKRSRQIKPVLGDARIERKGAANGNVGDRGED